LQKFFSKFLKGENSMVNLNRIDEVCQEKKWSRRKLEREAGIGVGSISKWTKVTPSTTNLKKVADALGVSTAFLTGDSDFRSEQDAVIAKWTAQQAVGLQDEVRRIEAGIRIPVLGDVPCGIPTEAIEMIDAEAWEEIPEKLARTGTFYGLTAKGDSMSPRIQEGDVLIVRQQLTAESGDVVIAKVGGEDATCKRLLKQEGGIVLQPFNPSYAPMYFSNVEVQTKPVVIIGKVIENRQKF
jgi:repressor LexA